VNVDQALVIEPQRELPAAEIAEVLSQELRIRLLEARLYTQSRLSSGAGVLIPSRPRQEVLRVAEQLARIGVGARVVPRSLVASAPSGYRAISLDASDPGPWRAGLRGGAEIFIERESLAGISVHAVRPEAAAEEEDEPQTKRQDGSAERIGADGRSRAADFVVPAKAPGGGRSAHLRESLAEHGLLSLRFRFVLLCDAAIGPVRFDQQSLDFSCLGQDMQAHSLDNFLTLLEQVVGLLPELPGRSDAVAFLDSSDPFSVAHLDEREALLAERWSYTWARALRLLGGGAQPA
jgi:hypothetical protein